jgi:hypothetical protein
VYDDANMTARTELFLTGSAFIASTIGCAILSEIPGWQVMRYPMVASAVLGLCTAVVSGGYAAAGGMREKIVLINLEKEEGNEAAIPIELPRSKSVLVSGAEV